MPDDPVITEQESVTPEPTEDDKAFSAAFGKAVTELDGGEPEKKVDEPKKKVEDDKLKLDADAEKDAKAKKLKKDEKDKGGETDADKKKDGDKEKKLDEEPEDEDVKRGAKLIEEEEAKAKADKDAADKKVKDDADAKAAEEAEQPEVIDNKKAEFYNSFLDRKRLPDTVEVDGETVDIGDALAEHPGFIPIIGSMVESVIDGCLDAGIMVHGKVHEKAVADLTNRLDRMQYEFQILLDHRDAVEVADSKEFKDWKGEQAKEVQALFRSGKPKDFVRGLKKYKATLKKADADTTDADAAIKAAEKTAKAEEKKKAHDDLHSDPVKKKGSTEGAVSPDDYSGSFKAAAKEIERLKKEEDAR